jgi:hypothetical protein
MPPFRALCQPCADPSIKVAAADLDFSVSPSKYDESRFSQFHQHRKASTPLTVGTISQKERFVVDMEGRRD